MGARTGDGGFNPTLMAILNLIIASLLCAFTLIEVNFPLLRPQSALALFGMAGLVLCFLHYPMAARWKTRWWSRAWDVILAVLAVICFGYVLIQSEPLFRSWWLMDQSLGGRAANEQPLDVVVAVVMLILVLESARRCLGWALPLLAMAFLAYAWWGYALQQWEWMLPHRGYSLERTAVATVLHTQGVFGTALNVMFKYVFLFVVFGALLSATGATQFIIEFAQRVFRRSAGAPAKVAVVSSGLMGSLSGSAVANVVTTGTFTIPMMRASGFRPEIAGGIEAAASSGGALVPPVMGAAAYLMLEILQPLTYLEIIRAALIPAILYYLSLFLFVHFHSRKLAAAGGMNPVEAEKNPRLESFKGVLFGVALLTLVVILIMGRSPFRAVTISLVVVAVLSSFSKSTRLTWRGLADALTQVGRDSVPLVCAAACVGIIIGVVNLTGVGTRFPEMIVPVAQNSLFGALVMIMIASLVLGMGLPSVVCYLLMATLVGPVLGKLGVAPLAAHMFIFYFGMMSMVTPPVALAGYAAASVAGSGIMITSWWAFRVALVGFTLPFMFVFRPELLVLTHEGVAPGMLAVAYATLVGALGVTAFASGLSGCLAGRLVWWERLIAFAAAAMLLFPAEPLVFGYGKLTDHDLAGFGLLIVLAVVNWRRHAPASSRAPVAAAGR